MNDMAVTTRDTSALNEVLRNSLYPGAQEASINLVRAYCHQAGLDPMQKPVHIVPMWDSKSGGMRDVIMPGIGLYRTQAARTGELAGISEPEFGPAITENIGGVEITYPEWCRVVVRRQMKNNHVAEFAAVERWRENYAVKGGKEKSIAPNAMWTRRPYAQLGKCSQAQALRMAFPEATGSQPTADEMEGKCLEDDTVIDVAPAEEAAPPSLPDYTDEQFLKNHAAWKTSIAAGMITPERIISMISAKYRLSDEQKNIILAMTEVS